MFWFVAWLVFTGALIVITKVMLTSDKEVYDTHYPYERHPAHDWLMWVAYPGWSLWMILTIMWAKGMF
jgi:hypothetical protein